MSQYQEYRQRLQEQYKNVQFPDFLTLFRKLFFPGLVFFLCFIGTTIYFFWIEYPYYFILTPCLCILWLIISQGYSFYIVPLAAAIIEKAPLPSSRQLMHLFTVNFLDYLRIILRVDIPLFVISLCVYTLVFGTLYGITTLIGVDSKSIFDTLAEISFYIALTTIFIYYVRNYVFIDVLLLESRIQKKECDEEKIIKTSHQLATVLGVRGFYHLKILTQEKSMLGSIVYDYYLVSLLKEVHSLSN
jgi:hypothetical protein